MANGLAPIPNLPVGNSHEWREWFFNLWESLGGAQGQIFFTDLNFTGSNITDIQTRAHNTLQGLQGGNIGGTEYYHLDASQYAAISALTSFKYAAFQDSTTQTIASTTTAYPITFNTTDYSNGVSIASGSQITFSVSGLYNIQFSLQFSNLDNASQDAEVWFRLNGTDISNSNSRFGLAPRKTVSDPFHIIGSLNFFVQVTAGDYVQLMWNATSTNVSLTSFAAGTSPTRPAIPCAILTVTQVA